MSDQNVNYEISGEETNEEISNVEWKENDENWESSTQSDQDGNKSWGNAIPYERFKEVNSNFKKSQSRIAELEAQLESSKNSKETEEEIDYDSLSQKELLDLAEKRAFEKIQNESKAAEKAKAENEKYISDKLQDFTDEWVKFDEEKLLKIALKTWWDLDAAMEIYKEFNPVVDKSNEEKAKKDARLKASESVRWSQKATWWDAKVNLRNVPFHSLWKLYSAK